MPLHTGLNLPRKLIWISLVAGLAGLFSWQVFHSDKNFADHSSVSKMIPPTSKQTAPFDSTFSAPEKNTGNQTLTSQTAPQVTPSAPENDPEKIAALISSLSEAEVSKWLASLTNQDLTGNTGHLLLRRWVELNPTAAVNWVTQLDDASARADLFDTAAIAWSQKDLPNALTWVESLPENATKHQALTDLGYEVARIDPVNAMQIATQLPAGENADALLLHALAQFASMDPSQSQQLALSLPAGPLRDRALATVATVQASQDGPGAARFAVENIPPGPDLERAVMGVVQLWGQNNLADTSSWVESFPNSPLRDQAVQNLGILGNR